MSWVPVAASLKMAVASCTYSLVKKRVHDTMQTHHHLSLNLHCGWQMHRYRFSSKLQSRLQTAGQGFRLQTRGPDCRLGVQAVSAFSALPVRCLVWFMSRLQHTSPICYPIYQCCTTGTMSDSSRTLFPPALLDAGRTWHHLTRLLGSYFKF